MTQQAILRGANMSTPLVIFSMAIAFAQPPWLAHCAAAELNRSKSAAAVDALKNFLQENAEGEIEREPFARAALTKNDASAAAALLRANYRKRIRAERSAEMKARTLTHEKMEMPFFYKVFGEKGPNGRSLYISMHGGGGAAAPVNDGQWENQKRLYSPKEGVYVAPRAPTNTWNLWHQGHIDPLFTRLIANLIVFEDVDPNRVYLMGYSAGGDGVYQLAPRMADQLAAASMMAGHPNETSPLGLRNLPFSLHVGGNDGAYNRNKIAREWSDKLAQLQKGDPQGYNHWAKVYEGKGHWLNREDAAAVPWMARFTRQRYPNRIVWKQDDVVHSRFYWLAVPAESRKARAEVIAVRDNQHVSIEKCDVDALTVRLNDEFIDLDKPVRVSVNGKEMFAGIAPRTISLMSKTLQERGDPTMIFSAEVNVKTE